MKNYQLQAFIVLLLQLARIRGDSESEIEGLCGSASTWTIMPNKQHCDRFYVCTGMKDKSYQEFQCPPEYHFNSQEQRCVRGSCSTRCYTTGVQRLEGDCTHFKRCSSQGELSVMKCSYGFYFDASRKACLPVNVTPAHQCSCILPEHSMLANSNDCRSYYTCVGGQAKVQQCPQNYYYDASVNSCLLDMKGECQPAFQLVELPLQECQKDVVSRYCTADTDSQCFTATTSTQATPTTTQRVSKDVQKVNSSKQADQLSAHKAKPEEISNNKLSSKFLLH
ncbi:uncharacterized protein LOC6583281 [Drosophila mojavensis]|uniref:Chitin-binding type-2 domain-containing protein n=1 Tax=Drosophila mojavensis TaxID=7230 RepID=B4KV90_DROMO|nr:uncharacterized protein LOC6583281 [Drosophila mojavensis]EDW19430.1 uncharacterized protein Dmoj_GI13772 [Drosophila mojavensis]